MNINLRCGHMGRSLSSSVYIRQRSKDGLMQSRLQLELSVDKSIGEVPIATRHCQQFEFVV